jgi:hypothetical protein
MNRQKGFLLVTTLVLMAGTGVLLARLHGHQTLGLPGVKTSPIAGTQRLQVDLPEHVLDYASEKAEPTEVELGNLPPDTSFGRRIYQAPDKFTTVMAVVLMGTDRTSLHKPQFCLEGQGWHIDEARTLKTSIHIERPYPYDLPVVRLITTIERTVEGRSLRGRGVYVYWYVADGVVDASVSGEKRMWLMARDMLLTGVLQRWAYVSCLSECAAGDEEANYERMKKLIAAAVPEFQTPPAKASAAARGSF